MSKKNPGEFPHHNEPRIKTARQRNTQNRKGLVLSTLYKIPAFFNPPEMLRISQLSGGMTNGTFKIDIKNKRKKSWVLRIAGKGTSAFINRASEKTNATAAAKLGLNVKIQWFDQEGTQLTPYLQSSQPLSSPQLDKKKYMKYIAKLFKTLHHHPEVFNNQLSITERNSELLDLILSKAPQTMPPTATEIADNVNHLLNILNYFIVQPTACHNDPMLTNFLVLDKNDAEPKIFLIDWEYSSKGDFLWDLVYFCLLAELDEPTTQEFLLNYFGQITDTINAWFIVYKPLVSWWVALWSYAQIANGTPSCSPKTYLKWAEQYLLLTQHLFESNDYQSALSIILRDKENNHGQVLPRSF